MNKTFISFHKSWHWWVGFALLFVAIGIGYTQVFWGVFADEGENLASGFLGLDNKVLFRDIFSHHFPFAHYWAEIIFRIFGPSIFAVRFSVLVFQVGVFGILGWLTRKPISIGILAIIWTLVRLVYFGNMVLYQHFSAFFMLLAFWIVFDFLRSRQIRRTELAILGFCFTASFLASPLSIYPIFTGCIFLLLGRCKFRDFLFLIAVSTATGLPYLIYLISTRTLDDFWIQNLYFNSKILSKYLYANPNRFAEFFQLLTTGLGIFSFNWFAVDWGWFKPLPIFMGLTIADHQVIGGLAYRGYVILLTLLLLVDRKVLCALFVYCFTASLLVRTPGGLHATSFALLGLFAGVWIVASTWRSPFVLSWLPYKLHQPQTAQKLQEFLFTRSSKAIAFLGLALLFWHGVLTNLQPHGISYLENFFPYEQRALEIRALSCNNSETQLAYYPGDPIVHFMTRMPTVSRYFYMYPWVADFGLKEVLQALQNPEANALVFIDQAVEIWGHSTDTYLAPLNQFLNKNYQFIGGFYRSPKLAQICPIETAQSPSK